MRLVRLAGIVRDIVEQHESSPNRILEINDVQAGRGLVKAIAVTAAVKAQQATDEQTQRGLSLIHI